MARLAFISQQSSVKWWLLKGSRTANVQISIQDVQTIDSKPAKFYQILAALLWEMMKLSAAGRKCKSDGIKTSCSAPTPVELFNEVRHI